LIIRRIELEDKAREKEEQNKDEQDQEEDGGELEEEEEIGEDMSDSLDLDGDIYMLKERWIKEKERGNKDAEVCIYQDMYIHKDMYI
jgi:hypothetical protein